MDGKRPKKIFLISIDTLRADHLGCYGYGKNTSPNLDRLGKEGTIYSYAFSPCPYTVPTHTSLLTGVYPINNSTNFAQTRPGRVDPDSTLFLQEILCEQGYATGAFVSCFVLKKGWGLNHGFDVYDDRMTTSEINRPSELIRDGRETNRAALEWINENRDENFFIWLHYFDVHGPYVQAPGFPPPFKSEDYGDSPVLLDRVRDGQPGGIPEYQLLGVEKNNRGEVVSYQRDIRHYLAGYDNGIRYVDTVIGELFEELKREGIYEESAIIVTADHGEALGENDVYFFHGLTVTPEQSRVPLIVKPSAGSYKPMPSERPVSTVDIMPTVLDWIGFSSTRLGLDGVSLFSQDPDRFILSENEWQRAIIWRDYYLLQAKDAVFDGFWYYFDSQVLCKGTGLFEYKSGKDVFLNPDGPVGRLITYAEGLKKTVDPKERRIKEKDSIILDKDGIIGERDGIIAERDGAIAEKDGAIAEKNGIIAERGRAVAERDTVIVEKDKLIAELGMKRIELESVLKSKSWKLTYPLRWVSARLKGING
ncbi:MAG: sulfatase [Nitrospirota bacterium]